MGSSGNAKKWIILLGAVGVAIAAGIFWYLSFAGSATITFRTAAVMRGNLLASVSATGTIEPEEVVDVGAQVVGMILELGRDPHNTSIPIDYCSEVEEGTILARLDPSLYKAEVAQAKADLLRCKAGWRLNEAKFRQTERDWARAQDLIMTKSIAPADYDLARANYEVAKASVDDGMAAIAQAEAKLDKAEINLSYTTIRSPVKGVIVERGGAGSARGVVSRTNGQEKIRQAEFPDRSISDRLFGVLGIGPQRGVCARARLPRPFDRVACCRA